MDKLKAVIVVAQRKGGVGKTTLTRMFGEYFAIRHGWDTCLLDLDSQSNLTKLLLGTDLTEMGARPPIHPDDKLIREEEPDFSGRSSSADIFKTGVVYPYKVTRPKGVPNLDIIPGNTLELKNVHKYTDQTDGKNGAMKIKIEDRLRDWIEQGGVREAYDVLIIDTPPSDSVLTVAALRAGTHLLIPVVAERQCVDGMHELLTMWRQENTKRRADDLLKILSIQPNKMATNWSVHQQEFVRLEENPAIAPYLSKKVLPEWSAFAYMDTEAAKPQSIFHLHANDKARLKAEEVCDYHYDRLLSSLNRTPANGEVANG